jgi:GT2 family glycosyltransferase
MPSEHRVSIHIVSWNSITHIPTCLDALSTQVTPEMSVMIVDNASVDGTVPWIEEHYPHFHLLRNTRNLGYCRGHNQAIRLTKSDYILFLNPDVIIGDGWIERGVAYLDAHPDVGAFGGKIVRYGYSSDELKEVVQSGIIDSTGLAVSRSRHTVDRGSGQSDTGQFDTPGEVFGFSGACVLYRRSALDQVAWKDEYLDNDLFAYKDDLDLSWRLQRFGWHSWYDPLAQAQHFRQVKGTSATSDRLIAKNHRSRTRFNSYFSYRNHWLVLLKNETWSTWWRDWPWILFYELKKFLFLTLTGQPSFAALGSAWKLWPLMRQKAAMLNHQATQSSLTVRRWFIS